jgi:CNT family concentrative nucleoside transporter
MNTDPVALPTPRRWRWAIGLGIVSLATLAWFAHDAIGSTACAALGVICFIGVAALCSTNLRQVNGRVLVAGLALQILLAAVILKNPVVYRGFEAVGDVITRFLGFSQQGAKFVFGDLADPTPAPSPASGALGGSVSVAAQKVAFPQRPSIFVFVALPTVIFVSSFFAILYHVRILQAIVWVFAKLMVLIMGKRGVSGAESLSAAANVFMGQTEAPLIVKPYVTRMTQSELLALMIGGMATISGGLMAVFISMGANPVAILATSVMAAPTGLYLSKLLMPETGEPETRGNVKTAGEKPHVNVIDAAASGASEGMFLVINIVAMLIAFIALIHLVNAGLKLIDPGLTLELIFARLFAPVAVLTGVPLADVPTVGELLGKKLVLNEFVALLEMTGNYQPTMVNGLSERGYILATFALTGFANFSSIGIQLGGIGAMAPTRRGDLARLGMRALLGGFLATLINASIAGMLI